MIVHYIGNILKWFPIQKLDGCPLCGVFIFVRRGLFFVCCLLIFSFGRFFSLDWFIFVWSWSLFVYGYFVSGLYEIEITFNRRLI